jgi:hypothetical protein
LLVAAIVQDFADKPLTDVHQAQRRRQWILYTAAALSLLIIIVRLALQNPEPAVQTEERVRGSTPTVSNAMPPVLGIEMYKSLATSRCLENPSSTTIHAKWRQLRCAGDEEAWQVYEGGISLEGDQVRVRFFQNVATDLCLESNDQGKVYTHSCNWGDYQKWEILHPIPDPYVITFRSLQSGLCLHSDPTGRVYTQACNGLDEQRWH